MCILFFFTFLSLLILFAITLLTFYLFLFWYVTTYQTFYIVCFQSHLFLCVKKMFILDFYKSDVCMPVDMIDELNSLLMFIIKFCCHVYFIVIGSTYFHLCFHPSFPSFVRGNPEYHAAAVSVTFTESILNPQQSVHMGPVCTDSLHLEWIVCAF